MKTNILIFIFVCITSRALFAEGGRLNDMPLFQSQEPLELTLVADIVAIRSDKSDDPEYTPAMLLQHFDTYINKGFDIKIKARGNTRRLSGLCDFPPLKFNFKKGQVKNTVFEGQDKLKFVSQCRQEESFQNYVLEEYLLYQTYHIITPVSYRTRLVNITIKDYKLRVPTITMTGFLIEDDESLAKRIDARPYEQKLFSQDSCESTAVDRLSMFQYMIGNTDYYIHTLHNTDIFELKHSGELIPVPFDFDFAGVINTPYASPSRQIPITQVRQRYFKGSCRDEQAYNPILELFNSKKAEIFALYNRFDYLPKTVIKKSLRYYGKFYKIINDPESVEESFYSVCNAPLYLEPRK
ncbi:MAG: hypothetical protein HC819_04200 [Cyclobacteriaceae bacterium]|nr:hypothetical protein [Cyclobacteriaceae bacterium]